VEHLSKSFGATRALQDVSFAFQPGICYALVGENGSGKSTLVKILAGVLRPDRGRVFLGTTEVKDFSPRRAIASGVATCFQEVLVEDNLSVLANLFLWDGGWLRPHVPEGERIRLATSVLAELSAAPPPVHERVGRLSLGARQLVVIGRALVQQRASVVLLDEPTAALDQSDSLCVLQAVRRRAAAGAIVVFTSHRLDEIEQIGDQIIVLRNGQIVGVLDRSDFNEARLTRLMSGASESLSRLTVSPSSPHVKSQPAIDAESRVNLSAATPSLSHQRVPAIRVSAVRLGPGGPPLDLTFYRGEITGLAGLDGHGQTALLKYLGGIERPLSGRVEVTTPEGTFVSLHGQHHAVKLGIVYVPRDRKTEGILPTLSVLDNFALPTLPKLSMLGFGGARRALRFYTSLARHLAIKAASWRSNITSLSGGNQQKVLIARWLATNPRVLLLDDPTRGVDIPTKGDLYRLFRELATEGKAVILVSTDLQELVTLCDRVIVMHRMSVSADLHQSAGTDITRQKIVSAMFGQEHLS
jgi:ABC-type sugar transport system ATPase subunit